MAGLFGLLFFISLICSIVGLIKPSTFYRFTRGEVSRAKVSLFFLFVAFISFVLFSTSIGTDKTKQIDSNKPGSEKISESKTITTISTVKELSKNVAKVKGIGVSYGDIMKNLSEFFVMQKSTPVNGEERYMGSTLDKMAMLEVIGNSYNISQTSLLLGVPKDCPQNILVRNSVVLLVFLKNSVPDWENVSEWVIGAIYRITESRSGVEKVVKGDKSITVTFSDLGMIIITVKSIAVSPDCYDLGYRYGRCSTLAMYGYKCPPDDDFVMPVECRGTEAAQRGIKAGVKSVIEVSE